MVSKKFIFILSIFFILISAWSVYAADHQQDMADINYILQNNNDTELTGCCSVVYQLDGNNSIFSFRRDSETGADIYIEKINWHGKEAIKQYKTENGYFCQAIITSDGWVIGYGGIDDGIDNERIENITATMISNDSSISEDKLIQIQKIKQDYGLGHVVIKAPNGNYGVSMATTEFRGKLEPGDYISVPNRETYVRSGDFSISTSDKIATMVDLARSDMFGLTRRDITTFYFHSMENSTTNENITDIYLSNDDGSLYEMSTGGLADDVYFNNTVFNKSDIPIAPNYQFMGSVVFSNDDGSSSFGFFDIALMIITIILLGILGYVLIQYYKYQQYLRRRRRR